MSIMTRNLSVATKEPYDIIIVGGGIYGVMLSFVASQYGLKNLLLERDDFGSATSYNSLRIIHGGLRYLQKADLHRFFESVGERRWFLRNFPGLVEPLPCLLPLYGKGIFRPSIFRAALKINDILSMHRNLGVPEDYHLSSGKIVSLQEAEEIFPAIDKQGLKGSAVWYDASIPDSQLLLMEILKQSCSMRTTALNYVEVQELIKSNGIIQGIIAVCNEDSKAYKFLSKVVVNTAGPWCRELAANFDKDYPQLFKSSLAWNVLFNKNALSDYALAITPKRNGAPTYFLRPWKGMLLAGTIHESWDGVVSNPMPSMNSVNNFIDDLNRAIPKLNLKQDDILHIFSGLLPAQKQGTNKLAVREVILDHGENGGINGLYSISGVKFTTARLVAEKTIKKVLYHSGKIPKRQPLAGEFKRNIFDHIGVFDFDWCMNGSNKNWKDELKKIIKEESVIHLDDLILRRTSLGDNPNQALEVAPSICELFDWDKMKCEREVERLKRYYQNTMPNKDSKEELELANSN